MTINSDINKKKSYKRKKEKLDSLFYIKSFERLRFSPLKLICIRVGSFSIWNKTNSPK
jgi:hypothetical protein